MSSFSTMFSKLSTPIQSKSAFNPIKVPSNLKATAEDNFKIDIGEFLICDQNKRVIHFLRAARDGDLEKVMEYLKLYKDLNPSTCNQTGLSAFHLACKGANIGIVTEFLRRGANIDASTKNGNTPLHIAALAGHYELVTLLVSSGATVNVQSQNGITPLYMAAQEGYLEVVKYLLDNGASQSLCAEGGFTPLIVAKQQGHKTVVETLLERGGAQSAEPLMPNVQNKVDINTKTSCSVQ